MEIIEIFSTLFTIFYLVNAKNRNKFNTIIFLTIYMYIAMTSGTFIPLVGIILFLLSEYTMVRSKDNGSITRGKTRIMPMDLFFALLTLGGYFLAKDSFVVEMSQKKMILGEDELGLVLLLASALLLHLLEKKWRL